ATRGRPAVNREAEGRFGDERVTANRFDRRAREVRFELVVTGDDADLAAAFDAHLGRPEDVPRRVERDGNAAEVHGLAVADGSNRGGRAEPLPQDGFAVTGREVVAGAGAGMVRMGVSNHRAIDRLPRIDVEIAGRAVEPAVGQAQQVGRHAVPILTRPGAGLWDRGRRVCWKDGRSPGPLTRGAGLLPSP